LAIDVPFNVTVPLSSDALDKVFKIRATNTGFGVNETDEITVRISVSSLGYLFVGFEDIVAKLGQVKIYNNAFTAYRNLPIAIILIVLFWMIVIGLSVAIALNFTKFYNLSVQWAFLASVLIVPVVLYFV
jgi:hypothetical protein